MEVCYRHPRRETGVACSNCGRPICPDCMTPTSVGMRCPECAGQRTKVRGIGAAATEPVLTYVLIGVNVAVALGGLLSGASTTGSGGLGQSKLIGDLAVSRAEVAAGDYWRILTSGFVHSGFFHLAFNMFALYILGGLLEPAIGRLRFGLIYLVSLLCGSFGALLLEPTLPTVGASGAIFGLMGAAVFVMRSRGISLMESGLGLWIGLNLLLTFTISNISVGGHIGGLVGGSVAAVLLLNVGERVRLPAYVPALLTAALGVVAVAAAIAISS
jgi:membrane associated rhomboid family serine protease